MGVATLAQTLGFRKGPPGPPVLATMPPAGEKLSSLFKQFGCEVGVDTLGEGGVVEC